MNPFLEILLILVWAFLVILAPWIWENYRDWRARRNQSKPKVITKTELFDILDEIDELDRKIRSKRRKHINISGTLRKEPTMAEHQNSYDKPKTLLERFADATHDIEMLNIFLQSMMKDGSALTLQQTVQRSLERAEREAAELKARYEEDGER